jgi:dCMP deaminase
VQAAYHGITERGGTLYCTHQPCLTCVKLLINAGIARVCYEATGGDPAAVAMLQDANIPLARA